MSRENLRTYIRDIIRELLDEKNLEETSFSSGAGSYNTPFAFTGKGKSGKKKKKEVYQKDIFFSKKRIRRGNKKTY